MDTNLCHVFFSDTDLSEMEMIELRHPKTNKKAMFFVSKTHDIYEMTLSKRKDNSWFIGDHVKSDGSWYLVSKVDPVFLALPYFHKHDTFRTLEDALIDDELPNIDILLQNIALMSSLKFALQFDDGMFKYNREKVFSWIDKKLTTISETLGLSKEKSMDLLSRYLSEDMFNDFTSNKS